MQPRTPNRLILAFALLLPAVASQATAPQDTDFRDDLLDKVQSVCANNPTQVCTTRLPSTGNNPTDGAGEFDPLQCPATPPPRECMIDYLPNGEIRALMTVSGDADVGPGVLIGVLIEFQIGEKPFVISKQYPPDVPIFGWNPIQNESDVFSFDTKFASTNHGSDPITSRLVEIAVAELGLPAGSIPVVQSAVHKTPELETDQSDFTQATGSVARYRITIRFAKPAPPPQ